MGPMPPSGIDFLEVPRSFPLIATFFLQTLVSRFNNVVISICDYRTATSCHRSSSSYRDFLFWTLL